MRNGFRFICAAIGTLGMLASAYGRAPEEDRAVVVKQADGAQEQLARRALIQIGPWVPEPYNIEEPYIDLLHSSSLQWTSDGMSTQELLDGGYIDKKTGLPVRLPNGNKWLSSGMYFLDGGSAKRGMHWDGEWVLEWEGDADIWIASLPAEYQWQVSKNRIEFTRDVKRNRTRFASVIQVRGLKGPLKALHLFRKENEDDFRAGKIFTRLFINAVSRYDIVRTLDLQYANATAIRSVDDLPGMEAAFWGNRAWLTTPAIRQPYRSAPLEAMVALAIESDTALWTTVPITLGNPVDLFDESVRREEADKWGGRYRAVVRENIQTILDSPEWDRYADRFVSALITQGYPEDRPLYVTLVNEVWNFAALYFMTTQYAIGVAEGIGSDLGIKDANYRHGYGVMSARWKLALDAALKRAGRERQPVIYVIEGQAAWADTTSMALEGAKRWLETKGESWSDHADGFGVSIASYWGDEGAFAEAREQKSGSAFVKTLEHTLIEGGSKTHFSAPKVVRIFKEHQAKAAAYGVRLIGAYEGGSHLIKPSDVPQDLYEAFQWGEAGGAVNKAVNDALADAFPGIILSNYGLVGLTGGQPWFEGPYGDDNPYMRSWEPYLRPEGAEGGKQ